MTPPVRRSFRQILIDYVRYRPDLKQTVADVAAHLGVDRPAAIAAAARPIGSAPVKAEIDAMAAEMGPVTQLRRGHMSETLGATHAGLYILPPELVDAVKALGARPL